MINYIRSDSIWCIFPSGGFMKRILTILLVFVLLFQLIACNDDPKDKETESDSNPQDTFTDNKDTTDIKDITTPETEVTKMNINTIDSYLNPRIKVTTAKAWVNYGVGDPFVMRYNGRYYMYCSTKDKQTGIQCWTSDDLVKWSYFGLCATEELTTSAYAPEVFYYNGYFYMYTSPAGNGHYVLKSESPTGPFVAVTDNFGLGIDGSVFIDDDGSWYFYSCGDNCIKSYTMSAPDKVNADSVVKTVLDLHGWTEGPMVVKHDGTYYLTYTGNHVWELGYRIGCAISTDSPRIFTPVNSNPILLATDTKAVSGIGHSSTVLGPNLDEYYIVYHSSKSVPKRSMNIDRIIFNGAETLVLGPSVTEQQAPAMPDIYSRFESDADLEGWTLTGGIVTNVGLVLNAGGRVLSNDKLSGDFTAEYNIKSTSDKAGVLFGYTDEQNLGRATYDAATSELTVEFISGGVSTQNKVKITASFSDKLRGDALIQFRVCKSGSEYKFFVNGREVFKCENALDNGAIGVFCEEGSATVGFVGATGGVLQSTFEDVYKPTESMIPAFTCVDGASSVTEIDGVKYLHATKGNSYVYKTNVSKSGEYDFLIEYRSDKECVLEIYDGGAKCGEITLDKSTSVNATVALRGLNLSEGLGETVISVKEGEADILGFYFHETEGFEAVTYDFESYTEFTYKDGSWPALDGKLNFTGEYGKFLVGSENWTNYIVESDITVNSTSPNAGLVVRVSNPSERKGDEKTCSRHLQGYFIAFYNDSLMLGKHNYDLTELARIPFSAKDGQTYHVSVEVNENTFKISVDGNLLITYTDLENPFLHGMVGYRSYNCPMSADNLTVTPIK